MRLSPVLLALAASGSLNAASILEPDGGSYLGVNLDDDPADSISAFTTRTGVRPLAMVTFVHMPLTDNDVYALEDKYKQLKDNGGILIITLEPMETALKDLTWDDCMRVANWCKDHDGTSGTSNPIGIMLRFAHEMNGDWYKWGQQPLQYVDRFKMLAHAVHLNTDNTAMLWAPNNGGGYPFGGNSYPAQKGTAEYTKLDTNGDGTLDKNDDPYSPYFPAGSDADSGPYVDWVGMTLYHWSQTWPFGDNIVSYDNAFFDRLTGTYNHGTTDDESYVPDFYQRYCVDLKLPMAVPETSALFNTWDSAEKTNTELEVKQSWMKQVYNLSGDSHDMATAYPMIKMVSWFDHLKNEKEAKDKWGNANCEVDWRCSNDTVKAAWKTAVRTTKNSKPWFLADGDLPVVTVSSSTTSIAESAGTSTITIHRQGRVDRPLVVNLTIGGTASSGDYALVTSATLPGGQQSTTLTLTAVQDTLTEGDETVTIAASSASTYTASGSLSVTIVDDENDSTAPVTASGYPAVTGISSTGFTVQSKLDEAGKAYVAVLADGATAPTAAQVKAGSVGLKTATITLAANTVGSATITGLSASTAYDVWVVAEDGKPNLQASPLKVDVSTTAPDITAPSLASGYPAVSNLTTSGGTVQVKASETGTVYYAVLPASATAPTSAAVKAGTNAAAAGSMAVTAATAATATISGLQDATDYVVYAVAEDLEPNLGASPSSATFTTLATPAVTANDMPSKLTLSGTLTGTVTVKASEACDLIVNLQTASGTYAYQGGTTIAVTAGVHTYDVSVAISGSSPLTRGTSYEWAAFLTPTGKGYDDRLCSLKTTACATANSITSISMPTSASSTGTVSGTVTVFADSDSDLKVNLQRASPYEWKGNGTVAVKAGVSTVAVSVSITNALTVGTSYEWAAFLTPTGKDYNDRLTEVTTAAVTAVADPDTTAPSLASGYPKADTATSAGFTLRAKATEAGHAYVVVLASGTTAPTSTQVKGGTVGLTSATITLTADTEGNTVLTGLAASTAYDAWVVCEDGNNNLQASPTKVTITTSAVADSTAPAYATGSPKVDTITTDGGTLRVTITEAGTAYYLIKAKDSGAPTTADVTAGTGGLKKGSIALIAATEGTASITGLSSATDYDAWIVAKDSADNLPSNPTKVTFTTATSVDSTPPSLVSGYPKADTLTTGGATLRTAITEVGTAYYLILAKDSTAPTAAAVKAGTSGLKAGSLALAASTEGNVAITSLSSATAYDAWFVAEDSASNLQTSPTKVAFTTLAVTDATPPTDVSGYPTITDATDSGFTIRVKTNEAGTVYYQILAPDAATPTPAALKASPTGSFTITAATEGAQAVTGQAAGQSYAVVIVSEDGSGNLQTSVTKLTITTTDSVAPVIATGYPKIDSITNTGFTLQTQADEASTVWYLIQAVGLTAPTAAQVKAGKTGSYAITAGSAGSLTITDLTAGTAFEVFVILEDAHGNLQANVSSVSVTTSVATPASSPSASGGGSSGGGCGLGSSLGALISCLLLMRRRKDSSV